MKNNRIVIFGWADSVHVQRWCEGLSQRGFQIKLISTGGDKLDSVETVILPRLGKLSYLANIPTVRQETNDFEPNLVHAHYIGGNGLLGWRTGFHPFIASVWGTDITVLGKKFFYKRILRQVMKSATHLSATSEFLKQSSIELERSVQNKISVIPFGVSVPDSVAEMPPHPPVKICLVKSLKPVYGIDKLLQAMSRVIEKFPDAKLNIAGKGPMEEIIRSMISQLNLEKSVSMVGFIEKEKVYEFIRSHHMMVMPSVGEEGFGVAALEAGACARPVIASRVGGVPEVVIDGTTGLLVPPGNVGELANSIIKLADNISLCHQLGQNGYYHVKENFQWEKSLDMMSELYERLIYESQKS